MRTRDSDKEQLVIEKAIGQIATDGFEGFSMNKLAKACNISVATLYIYYKDKDDLIRKIGIDLAQKFFSITLKDFSPDMPFDEGLWKQWQNRSAFAVENPELVMCFEAIRNSPHAEQILQSEQLTIFKNMMMQFCQNAIDKKELTPLPIEVFWSVAYGPLYSLLRFHSEGKSVGGRPFTLNEEVMKNTYKIVLKALKP